jgi:hypothetical protein
MLEFAFNKGDKAITISDKEGVFKLIEVEVYGVVYQDNEKDKPANFLYVFDLEGERKFGNADIMFKTREEAIEKLSEMVPEYEKGYADEIANTEQALQNLKDHRDKLLSSAQEIITIK